MEFSNTDTKHNNYQSSRYQSGTDTQTKFVMAWYISIFIFISTYLSIYLYTHIQTFKYIYIHIGLINM